MRLIIGGFAQGKTTYAKRNYGNEDIFDDFHLWFRSRLNEGGEPEEEISRMIDEHPGLVLISDEIGNGVVPVSAEDREYRERLGRCLNSIAERADSVERVFCGLGQKLK
ncbi:MAG: bifunctional adenosylcobinamide kinase/adenosylcobinamide-phosphate guanylyltransferase [Lachnospiraceae bacterium]|nr:bifunctional adenosylcobinamide kinase/adenosylcobinamide-phosphate guanylyltransferase [Lachnospiraceae bacterium]